MVWLPWPDDFPVIEHRRWNEFPRRVERLRWSDDFPVVEHVSWKMFYGGVA